MEYKWEREERLRRQREQYRARRDRKSEEEQWQDKLIHQLLIETFLLQQFVKTFSVVGILYDQL